MKETKYQKALKNGKTYAEVKSQAGKIREYLVIGFNNKENKSYTTTARARNNAHAKSLGLGWAKSHGLDFERALLLG